MIDYVSGSASSWSDLRSALEAFAVSMGWTAAAGTGANRLWSKGSAVIRSTVNSDSLQLVGATGIAGSASTGDSPVSVKICSAVSATVTFPVTYFIHGSDDPDEIYLIVNYNGDKYQHLNFGVSDIAGIGGTGLWFTGSARGDRAMDNPGYDNKVFINAGRDTTGSCYINVLAYAGFTLGYFFHSGQADYGSQAVHNALDTTGWKSGSNGGGNPIEGNGAVGGLLSPMNSDLIAITPSDYNEGDLLIPINAFQRRASGLLTIIATMRLARFMRMDNVAPGDIISFGSEQWKCYPLFARNTIARDGVQWTTGAEHSGTLGVAIRYEP